VKPEMTASVTFQEPRPSADADAARSEDGRAERRTPAAAPAIVLMPKRAVTEAAGQPGVWVVAGGAVSRRAVVLGADRLDQVEVKSGVVPGEVVILNPPAGLVDRALVRVRGAAGGQ
jgi:hypothetical protein